MISFRKKILLSDVILFLIFIALLFPFIGKTVGRVVKNSLEGRVSELVVDLSSYASDKELIQSLQEHQMLVFFRVSLIDPNGYVLYDSHIRQLVQEEIAPKYMLTHPEVVHALQKGMGYSEGFSHLFSQRFAYVAKAFQFQGKTYILRAAFPMNEIEELINKFEISFLTLGGLVLLLYSLMTWAIMHRLSKPIQQIIQAVKPYQEGREEYLPQVALSPSISHEDDFGKLAYTMNSLSKKIEKQITTLTNQTKETRAILDSLSEGVIAVATNGVIIYANQMATQFLHLEDVQGKGLLSFSSRTMLVKKCQELYVRALKEEKVVSDSILLECKQMRYINIVATPIQNGIQLVLQDKTSDFKMVQVGKDFVANASHELRTPITIIRGFAETLQNLPNLTPKMLQEITDKMISTCERLNSLVQSLLRLSDLEHMGSLKRERVDLSVLVENAIHTLTSMHKEVDIDFVADETPTFVDPSLTELALLNLLDNAVKYSDKKTKIHVELSSSEGVVKLKIQDHGMGIPKRDLPHIFDRFYRVDKARSRKKGGVGLGLSIVKTIIEKQGGQIKVESAIDQGTLFTLSFPLQEKSPLISR